MFSNDNLASLAKKINTLAHIFTPDNEEEKYKVLTKNDITLINKICGEILNLKLANENTEIGNTVKDIAKEWLQQEINPEEDYDPIDEEEYNYYFKKIQNAKNHIVKIYTISIEEFEKNFPPEKNDNSIYNQKIELVFNQKVPHQQIDANETTYYYKLFNENINVVCKILDDVLNRIDNKNKDDTELDEPLRIMTFEEKKKLFATYSQIKFITDPDGILFNIKKTLHELLVLIYAEELYHYKTDKQGVMGKLSYVNPIEGINANSYDDAFMDSYMKIKNLKTSLANDLKQMQSDDIKNINIKINKNNNK